MSIKVTVVSILPDWWGAEEAFASGGADAVRDLINEDYGAFMADATVEVAELPGPAPKGQP